MGKRWKVIFAGVNGVTLYDCVVRCRFPQGASTLAMDGLISTNSAKAREVANLTDSIMVVKA